MLKLILLFLFISILSILSNEIPDGYIWYHDKLIPYEDYRYIMDQKLKDEHFPEFDINKHLSGNKEFYKGKLIPKEEHDIIMKEAYLHEAAAAEAIEKRSSGHHKDGEEVSFDELEREEEREIEDDHHLNRDERHDSLKKLHEENELFLRHEKERNREHEKLLHEESARREHEESGRRDHDELLRREHEQKGHEESLRRQLQHEEDLRRAHEHEEDLRRAHEHEEDLRRDHEHEENVRRAHEHEESSRRSHEESLQRDRISDSHSRLTGANDYHTQNHHTQDSTNNHWDPNQEDENLIVHETHAQEVATGINTHEEGKFLMDSPSSFIEFYGHDKMTVFMITVQNTLYRSIDAGLTWENQNVKMGSPAGVMKIEASHANENLLAFETAHHKYYLSKNLGENYYPIQDLRIKSIKFHPTKAASILALVISPECDSTHSKHAHKQLPKHKKKPIIPSTIKDKDTKIFSITQDKETVTVGCHNILMLSEDMGLTWSELSTYVVQFEWAPSPIGHTLDSIYAIVLRNKVDDQLNTDPDSDLVVSHDFFKTEPTILVAYGNRMAYTEFFVFVSVYKPGFPGEVFLKVNRDNLTSNAFQDVFLPFPLLPNTFKLLDASEGSAFLHVSHTERGHEAVGNVYISDATGSSFSFSLYRVANDEHMADFEKINGIEGIYVANILEGVFDVDEEDESNQFNLIGPSETHGHQTVISRDKGASWDFLPPPTFDHFNKPYICPVREQCHLHLHFWRGQFGPLYSTSTAIGLIIATGNVGPRLSYSPDETNTYLSRDAGLTWYEIAKGSHIYEIGNHGGIIVMANDHSVTNMVMYSVDEGLTFHGVHFSNTHIHIDNIVIEPTNSEQVFMLLGHQDGSGVAVQVDFRGFHEAQCHGYDAPDTQQSDYETWAPYDGHSKGKCLLGRSSTYVRRKREKQCFIPKVHNPIISIEHCECTEYDFECDVGFMRDISHNGEIVKCIPDPNAIMPPQQSCEGFYTVSKGYRRIAGDSCIGGEEFLGELVACPASNLPHASMVGFLILCILVIFLVGMLTPNLMERFEPVRNWVNKTAGGLKNSFSNVQYKNVNTVEKDKDLVDDDFGFDNDDEVNNQADLLKDDSFEKPAPKPLLQNQRTFAPLPPAAPRENVVIPILAPHADDTATRQ